MHISIRVKIILFTFLPIAAIYAVIFGYGMLEIEEQARRDVEREMTELAWHYASKFDARIREAAQIATSTADFMETRPELGEEEIFRQLRANVDRNPLVYGAAIVFEPFQYRDDVRLFAPYVFRGGDGLTNIDIAVAGYDYTEPRWQWWNGPRQSGRSLWTDPYLENVGAGNVAMSTFSVPFRRDGRFRGVTTIDVALTPLQETANREMAENLDFIIITEAGRFVFHPDRERIAKESIFAEAEARGREDLAELGMRMTSGQSGVMRMRALDADRQDWVFFAPIESTNWGFAARISEDEALARERARIADIGVYLGLSLLLIVVSVWLVSGFITRPIARLNGAVREIAAGNLETRVGLGGNDEIGALGRSFHHMANRLAQRERALKQAREENLGRLVNGIRGGYFYYAHDRSGNVTYVSPSIQDVLGYRQDEFCRHYTAFLTKNPINDTLGGITDEVLEGRHQEAFEVEVYHKDGRSRRLEIYEVPVVDESGLVVSVEGMAHDITERVDATERFRGLLESAPDSMVIVDADGGIVLVNAQTEKMFGYPREELLGKPIEMLIPERFRRIALDAGASLLKKPGPTQIGVGEDLCAMRRDGAEFPVEINIGPLETEEGLLISSSIRDISERKRMEQALREGEERFELAMEAASDGLWDWDMESGEVYYSPRYLSMLGYEADELPQSFGTFRDLLHPEDRERVLSNVHAYLRREEGNYELEYRMRTRRGDFRWILSRGMVAKRSASGRPLRAIGTHVDITERKLAETAMRRSEEKFRVLFQHTSSANIIFDDNGIVDCNRAAAELFGYQEPAELLSVAPFDLSPQLQADGSRSMESSAGMIARAKRHGHHRFDWIHRKRDGQVFPVEVTLTPLMIDNRPMMLATLHDLTERKRAEEEILKARDAAQAANRAKSEFLSNMSHELRTPLNGVLGYAQVLQRAPEVTRGQRDNLDAIESCGQHLLTLINDVLDLSKIESGGLEIHTTSANLRRLLKGVFDIVSQRAEGKGLALRLEAADDLPELILTDETKLRQILVNLLGNAVKFTDHGHVLLSAERDENGYLRFVVSDSGAGIDQHKLDEIFEPFKQGEAGKRLGGTGLGLSISRRLARAMGGEIGVQSTLGEGSRFTVILPLVESLSALREAPDEPGTEHQREPMLEPGRKVTVLIADDTALNRDILVQLLRPAGFDVLQASNGREALDRVREHLPDLVLMDIRMPEMDGLEATKVMRDDEKLRKIPVIAVSASVLPDFQERIAAAGCDDFIGKPIRAGEVFAKIERLLGLSLVYTRPGETVQATSPSTEPLPQPLCHSLADRLRDAADLGDVSELSGIAEELKSSPYDGCQLAGEIERSVKRFDFDNLLQIAERLDGETTAS